MSRNLGAIAKYINVLRKVEGIFKPMVGIAACQINLYQNKLKLLEQKLNICTQISHYVKIFFDKIIQNIVIFSDTGFAGSFNNINKNNTKNSLYIGKIAKKKGFFTNITLADVKKNINILNNPKTDNITFVFKNHSTQSLEIINLQK